jgi:nucleotide-binding universal stress UspA family protein
MSDITDKVKEKLKDAKDKVTSTTNEGVGGVSSQLQTRSSYALPKYSAIVVPHDGSEMSDKALSHAIYLSNMSGAEIVILHVVEDIHHIDSTVVLATSKEEGERGGGGVEAKDIGKKKDYEIKVEGEVKQMIEDKMRFCKQAGVKSQVSYKIQIGKAVDEIIKMSEDVNVDLMVIASSKKPSLTTRLLGSTSRKVIDSIEKPVLIIHG